MFNFELSIQELKCIPTIEKNYVCRRPPVYDADGEVGEVDDQPLLNLPARGDSVTAHYFVPNET